MWMWRELPKGKIASGGIPKIKMVLKANPLTILSSSCTRFFLLLILVPVTILGLQMRATTEWVAILTKTSRQATNIPPISNM